MHGENIKNAISTGMKKEHRDWFGLKIWGFSWFNCISIAIFMIDNTTDVRNVENYINFQH